MQSSRYRTAVFFCGLFVLWNMQAQVGTWKTYRAYDQATIVAETPNLVFGVYDGSLLSYNPADKEIKTYSKQNGLHDTDIRQMAYCPTSNALVLVYANANIDIFMGENDVYNHSSIKDDPFTQDKTVYNLEIIGDYAYISTAFGIVVIDVKKKERKSTYRLGAAVKSVCQKDNYLYAATSDGIKKALITSNLLDRENWKPIDETTEPFKDAIQLLFFKDCLFILAAWNQILYIDTNGTMQWFGLTDVQSMKVLNDQLVVSTTTYTRFYSDITNYTEIPLPAYSVDCRNSNNQYWLASGEAGLTGLTKMPNSSDYNVIASEITVNSPKRNLNFFMTFKGNKLLITGGGKDSNRQNIPGTLMVYEDGKWYNFDENAIAAQTGLPCMDFVSVTVDPSDPAHYFVGSWGEGLYEFRNNEFVNLYSLDNSSLQTAVPGSNRFIRVDGMVFDKNNNLYMVNAEVQNGLSIFLNQKEWKSFYYPPLASAQVDKILISRTNQKWFNFYRTSRAGIMVLDENGTIGDASDDQVAYSGAFVDQQGTDIKATIYIAMAEDQNGLVWVGTDNGPIYFTSMDQVNRGVCNRIISSDQYNEGYRPLEGVKITSIAVDGGNRKWMGSSSAGVFVVDDSNGSDVQIKNYTTDNSFLLSNTINSLAINNETGEVFIGTDKGLCSCRSEAIAGKPDYSNVYAFPNPVRPASGNAQVVVTGLMQNSTVKITDLTGNLIQEGKSMGGQYVWNCADRYGNIVKAGIYLVLVANPDGNQGVVTKIMVIK